MAPPDECFDACGRSGLEIDLRLIMQHELAPLECTAQAALEELSLDGADIHIFCEELIVVPAFVFCMVHRSIRTADQALCVYTVLREDADADTGRDMEVVLRDAVRLCQRPQDLIGTARSVFCVFDLCKQDHEFIAPCWLTVSELRTQAARR